MVEMTISNNKHLAYHISIHLKRKTIRMACNVFRYIIRMKSYAPLTV